MLKRKLRLDKREKTYEEYHRAMVEAARARIDKDYRKDLRGVMALISSQIDMLVEQRWEIIYRLDDGKTKDLVKEKNVISSKIDKLYSLKDLINNCQKRFVAISRINKSQERESYSMPLSCGSVLCPRCSKKKSKVHNRKVFRIARWMLEIRDVNGDKQPFHSIVFTLPLKLRKHFASEKMLNVLFQAANETLKDVVGCEGWVGAMHFYGHKSDEYNPHVNSVFSGVSSEGRLPLPKILSKDELKELRETFLSKVLENATSNVWDELFGADVKVWRNNIKDELKTPVEPFGDKEIKKFVKKKEFKKFVKENANCHRTEPKSTDGQKKHNLLYIFRGTLPLDKLVTSSQEVKDLFLFDLSPCKGGLTKGGRGKGFRNVRYFGAYRCSNRKKYLEENGIVVPENPGFVTSDDDTKFEIVSYDGKPRLFSFDGVVLGKLNLELGLQEVHLDDHWFDETDDDYD